MSVTKFDKLGRVGFLIPEFPTQTHIAWWRISKAMRARGVEVHLLSTRRPDDGCPHPMLQQAARETFYLWPPSAADALMALPVAARNPVGLGRFIGSLEAFKGLRRARVLALFAAAVRLQRFSRARSLDHVFVHSCGDAAYVVAMCRLLGGPAYSLRLGGDLEVYGTDHPAKMKLATLIVPAAAPYEDRLVKEIGLERDQVMWSWVGTDTELFRPANMRRGEGPLRIVTVARLNLAKGYQHALPAIASLRDRGINVEYTIVGEGRYRPDIEKLVEVLGLAGRVRLVGSKSAEEIAEIHAASDLFMLPTSGIGEGTPAAVCEAMSAGLPILATRVGGLADMVTEGVHGRLVPPGDSDALSQAIGTMVSDLDALNKMGRESRARAEREFSVEGVAGRILAKINERMSRQPRV
jgi:glycosyltransferase involved in cell wall biosynthesis